MQKYTKKRVCGNCGHDGFMWENVTLVWGSATGRIVTYSSDSLTSPLTRLVGEDVADRIVTRRACARCNSPSPYGDNDRLVDFGGIDDEKGTEDTGGGRTE